MEDHLWSIIAKIQAKIWTENRTLSIILVQNVFYAMELVTKQSDAQLSQK